MQANEIKFRASSVGYIMTDARSKSELLSETCKIHLIDVFVSKKYGRNTDIHTKYTNKGLQVEEDSITLYSRMQKTFFKKNENRIENEFICGTPDLFIGESIEKSELIIDIKSSWDIFTFFRANNESLNKKYYWQLQAYMDLTGAKNAKLVYCLINTPDQMINDEKRKLMWRMGAIDENELTDEAFSEIERNMIYDDIPMEEKFFEIEVTRNDADISKMHQRVIDCRNYMNESLFKTELIA